MDLRKDGWFAQLAVTGVAVPTKHEGSVMKIMGEILKDLQTLSPRALVDGKEILIRIRDRPVTESKHESSELERVQGIESMIETINVPVGPSDGMTHRQYVEFLINDGVSAESAVFLADDWFGVTRQSSLSTWMTDPKAARFRMLNSSIAAYENASPGEYPALLKYCQEHYSEFLKVMNLRVAT